MVWFIMMIIVFVGLIHSSFHQYSYIKRLRQENEKIMKNLTHKLQQQMIRKLQKQNAELLKACKAIIESKVNGKEYDAMRLCQQAINKIEGK